MVDLKTHYEHDITGNDGLKVMESGALYVQTKNPQVVLLSREPKGYGKNILLRAVHLYIIENISMWVAMDEEWLVLLKLIDADNILYNAPPDEAVMFIEQEIYTRTKEYPKGANGEWKTVMGMDPLYAMGWMLKQDKLAGVI